MLAELRRQHPPIGTAMATATPPPHMNPIARYNTPINAEALPVSSGSVPTAGSGPNLHHGAGALNLSGRTLGAYQLIRKMAESDLGTLYLGENTTIGKQAAVKVLGAHLVQSTEFLKQFVREARMAAQLDHPNIIQVWDVGEQAPYYYLVMQYVEGESLNTIIEHRKLLPPREALKIAISIADALAYAHAKGFVHKSLTPESILISVDGQVKITDFGIHRTMEMQTSDVALAKGKPNYMSPEHWNGAPIVEKSDLYSLGIILYRFVTGDFPYPAQTPMQILRLLATADPTPVQARNPQLPPSLCNAIMRLIAKEADHRPASADEALRLLKSVRDELRTGLAHAGAASDPIPVAHSPVGVPTVHSPQAVPTVPGSRPGGVAAGGSHSHLRPQAGQPHAPQQPGVPYATAYPAPQAPAERIASRGQASYSPHASTVATNGQPQGPASGVHRIATGGASGVHRAADGRIGARGVAGQRKPSGHGRAAAAAARGQRGHQTTPSKGNPLIPYIMAGVAIVAVLCVGIVLVLVQGSDGDDGTSGAGNGNENTQRNNNTGNRSVNGANPVNITNEDNANANANGARAGNTGGVAADRKLREYVTRAIELIADIDSNSTGVYDLAALEPAFTTGAEMWTAADMNGRMRLDSEAEKQTQGVFPFSVLLMQLAAPLADHYRAQTDLKTSALIERDTAASLREAAEILSRLEDWPVALKNEDLVKGYADARVVAQELRDLAAARERMSTFDGRVAECETELTNLEALGDNAQVLEARRIETLVWTLVEEADAREDWDAQRARGLLPRLLSAVYPPHFYDWRDRLRAGVDADTVLGEIEDMEIKYVGYIPRDVPLDYAHFNFRRQFNIRTRPLLDEFQLASATGTLDHDGNILRITGPAVVTWNTEARGGGRIEVNIVQGGRDNAAQSLACQLFLPNEQAVNSYDALITKPCYYVGTEQAGWNGFYWQTCPGHFHMFPFSENENRIETPECDVTRQTGTMVFGVQAGAVVELRNITFTNYSHRIGR